MSHKEIINREIEHLKRQIAFWQRILDDKMKKPNFKNGDGSILEHKIEAKQDKIERLIRKMERENII